MPNHHMQWNNISNIGNPTQSTALNDVIKKVKKFEVRQQGAPSQAHRSCNNHKFTYTQQVLKEEGECLNSKYGI